MQHFTASDGGRIAYRDQGRGTPLVLLHGLMAHGDFFRLQGDLSDRFRLITVDLRGHGASGQGADALTLGRMSRDVAELSVALDIQDAIGLGWSLGATILWHVLAGPEGRRFAGSIVVDMTARVENAEDWQLGLTPEHCAARTQAIESDFEAFALQAGQNIFAQPLDRKSQALASWAGFEFARNDAQAISAVWRSLMEQDMRPTLACVRQPTLIIHGGRSLLYGDSTAEHLAATLPHAERLRFAESGHAPHLEEPARFNAAVRDFADRLHLAPAPQPIRVQGGNT